MTYYELFEIAPTASADEIKRAFRREIAKYHPDKVQHLGREFQEIAAVKAAELTEAYTVLSDEALRHDYNERLASGARMAPPPAAEAAAPRAAPRAAPVPPAAAEPPPSSGASPFQQDRAGASNLLQKATVARFRQVLAAEFGRYEEAPVQGFEVTCIPARAFLRKVPPRVLARFVTLVDGAAVAETWALAGRMKRDDQRDLCVFVMGPSVAPPRELAAVIAEQRRKPMPAGGKLVMVPVNTRSWAAHVPTDAPPVVKALLERLRAL